MKCSPWYQTWALGAGCAAGYEVAGRYDGGPRDHDAPRAEHGEREDEQQALHRLLLREGAQPRGRGGRVRHSRRPWRAAAHRMLAAAVPSHATPQPRGIRQAGTVRRGDTVNEGGPSVDGAQEWDAEPGRRRSGGAPRGTPSPLLGPATSHSSPITSAGATSIPLSSASSNASRTRRSVVGAASVPANRADVEARRAGELVEHVRARHVDAADEARPRGSPARSASSRDGPLQAGGVRARRARGSS